MTKLSRALLLWTLILCACSSGITTPQTSPEQPTTNTPSPRPDKEVTLEFPLDLQTQGPTGPKIIVTVGTPNIGQGPDGNFPGTKLPSDTCTFAWAHSQLEELTAVLDTSIKELNSQASAQASAFGEDCVYADGRKVFISMETDFYINLPVTDLTDFETFGDWIAQTMPVVSSLPSGLIEGTQTGFVEYKFERSAAEMLIVRVPIKEYEETARGETGERLFRLFYE